MSAAIREPAAAEESKRVSAETAGVEAGVAGESSAAAGAARGVEAEDPGNIAAGFNLSTETITFFPPFRMVKVLVPRSTTSKGPSYGGTRGRRTASTRKKTWEEEASAGSTRDGTVPW